MLVYWAAFLIPAFQAVFRTRYSAGLWYLTASIFALFIGLRYRVGGDWGTYIAHLNTTSRLSLIEVLTDQDPGYYLLNWVAAQFGFQIWFVNLLCGLIFMFGLTHFIRKQPLPLLALAIAVPYLIIVVGMGYTRQAAALGMVFWGLSLLLDRRLLGFFIAVALAATFHKSAVLLVPIIILANSERRLFTWFWGSISVLFLYLLFLSEQIDNLFNNYVVANYAMASQGGPIRVAMNFVPAVLFLALRNRFPMNGQQRTMWFWISVFSLGSMIFVFQAPTAVDRLALYFLPLQLAIWSHFPLLFVRSQQWLVTLAIILIYGSVQLVWLMFSSNRLAWLPYQFWPLVAL
jgi:hypothetical protein